MSDRRDRPPSVKYRTPLREAQRHLTRSRIVNAARNLFYDQHFDTATMEGIALAAGLRRSTLYLHYKDKAEILLEVITEYGAKAKSMLATMPGPHPSLPQMEAWVRKVARFIAKERVPLSIIVEVRRKRAYGATLDVLTNELLDSMGTNNPAFSGIGREKGDPARRARALMLLQELTYACEIHLEDTSEACGRALLRVAAEDFCRFLTENARVGTP
jgi:AcrR family transcriptional regulator